MSKPKDVNYDDKINKTVEMMMNEKNDNPRDSTFRYLEEFHPEAQHHSLRFPGKFVESLKTEVFTVNNRNYRMDSAHLVLPDDTIPCKATVNGEQQTTPLNPNKIHALYDYKIHLIIKYSLVALNVVVTNIGDEDHTVIYESHGDAFKVYVRVFNDLEISQRLKSLKEKVKNKKELSEVEMLDFAYVLLFAKDNVAKQYSQEIAKLFRDVSNLNEKFQLSLHYVLRKLIRVHFRDDDSKAKELLLMITKALNPKILDDLSQYEIALMKIEERDNIISDKDNEIYRLKRLLRDNGIPEV